MYIRSHDRNAEILEDTNLYDLIHEKVRDHLNEHLDDTPASPMVTKRKSMSTDRNWENRMKAFSLKTKRNRKANNLATKARRNNRK